MTTLCIRHPHDLPPEELRRRLEHLAEGLSRQLELDYHWEGERLVFRRSGAHGHIAVLPGEVEIALTLGLLLTPLQGRIEQTVRGYLEKELG